MAKKKILMLLQLPPPVHGSAVSNKLIWESAAIQEAFDLTLLRIDFARSLKELGRLKLFKFHRAYQLGRTLYAKLKAEKFDAVYITLSPTRWAFLRDMLLMALVARCGVPRIYHMRGKGVAAACRKSWLHKQLYRWVFSGAKVIHLSQLLLSDIAPVYPVSQAIIVPNGRPDPGPQWIAPLADTPRPTILYLSNMIETKGPGVLLEALGLLKEKEIPFEAVFAGSWDSDIFKGVFENAVRALKLEECVKHIGPVYGDEKNRTYQQADIFVFPSFFECFPGVVLEAMSHGLPVVATREGAIPDMVMDNHTGLLVPPHRPDRLALALEAMLKDASLRRSLGAAGRKRFEQYYDFPVHEQAFIRALASCV